jgi:hypothetical protein
VVAVWGCHGHQLAAFLAEIERSPVPPEWPAEALRSAWDGCDDVATMVAVLLRGAAMGVFAVDSRREQSHEGVCVRWLFRLRSAGRFYRIDVGRGDGGDAMRRCFPDFPGDWRARLAAELDAMPPLDRLRSDLSNGREPRIDDATERAWDACDDPMMMLVLLRLLGHAAAAARLVDALPEMPREGLLIPPDWMRRAAARIRTEFPRLTHRGRDSSE